MSGEVGSGWFINFSGKEKDFENDFVKHLEENNYKVSPEGIKEFIADVIYEKEAPSAKSKIVDAINENPDAVAQGLNLLGKVGTHLINKKIFGK